MKKEPKKENKKEETIEELLEKREKDKRTKTILIIIIIILLLLFWLLGYRMGRIGFGAKDATANPNDIADEKISLIKVMQDDLQITKDTQLDIFSNVKYDGEKIIAPKSSGTYQFCVSNEAKNDILYHIKFSDEMKNFVNMKYRLKIDNVYIRGNENNYVSIEQLDVDNITVLKDSNNIFTLEWYWEDSDEKDTFVGSQEERQYYTLNLEIEAKEYEEQR